MKAKKIDGELKIGKWILGKGGISAAGILIQSRRGYRLVNGSFGLVVQTLDAPGVTIHLPKMSEKAKKEAVTLSKEFLGWYNSF